MGCLWVYIQKVELRYWWEYGDEKGGIDWFNEKRLLIPGGLRVSIWKTNFCVFCGFPICLDVRKGRKLPYAVYND